MMPNLNIVCPFQNSCLEVQVVSITLSDANATIPIIDHVSAMGLHITTSLKENHFFAVQSCGRRLSYLQRHVFRQHEGPRSCDDKPEWVWPKQRPDLAGRGADTSHSKIEIKEICVVVV